MTVEGSNLVEAVVSAKVMEIRLQRPERKNALNQAMYRELAELIQQGAQAADVRVLLLRGSDDCFTSGNDLADFAQGLDVLATDNPIVHFMTALANCTKPVVVAVEGVAVGIGTTLLLHADLVYAAPDASFRLPFASLGLCPEFASSYLLPRLVGHAKAAEWLLLGEPFSATDALDGRLINAVVSNPLERARKQAAQLAKQPPVAVQRTKALMKQHTAQPVDGAIRAEIEEFSQALQGAECREAIQAFFEKRAPQF